MGVGDRRSDHRVETNPGDRLILTEAAIDKNLAHRARTLGRIAPHFRNVPFSRTFRNVPFCKTLGVRAPPVARARPRSPRSSRG